MMGRLNHDQEQLFYSFRLDKAVPEDHPVREVAAVLDLSWVHSELTPYYPRLGRPSIDPALMIRMLIIGYVFGIRSERALCREVGVNLAYRWFCGLSIEDKVPDHSAFSHARNERFRDSGIFRSVFERVVGACIGAGLVGGEGFAVDASLIAADANKQRSTPGVRWNKELDAQAVGRATQDYLATLDDAAFGAASDVTPKFVSPSDPAAQWTGAKRGPAFFAYSDNYLIDVKSGIIMDVEASRANRQAEVSAAKTMIERTEQRFDIKPERLAGDTAYGSGANLDWLVNQAKIAPHIPVVDKSRKHSTDRAVIVNVSRCCLPISSGSFGSVVCGCVARAVPSSSSHWQQSRSNSPGFARSLSDHRRSQRCFCVSSVELVAPPACYRADGEDSKSSVSCHSLMSADFCNKIGTKRTSQCSADVRFRG